MSNTDVIPGRLGISTAMEFRLNAPATLAHVVKYTYSAQFISRYSGKRGFARFEVFAAV
jgi:hypothetical protein